MSTQAIVPMRFKVLFKMPGHKAVQGDYIFDNLHQLLEHLREDGVHPTKVEFIYVHHTPEGSTKTMEMMAVDNTDPTTRPSAVAKNAMVKAESKESTAVKTPKREDKPHVKLAAATMSQSGSAATDVAYSYLYMAAPAV